MLCFIVLYCIRLDLVGFSFYFSSIIEALLNGISYLLNSTDFDINKTPFNCSLVIVSLTVAWPYI